MGCELKGGEVKVCVCVGGVGAYLPRLPLLLYPKGWIRVLIVTFDTCVSVCVCVFQTHDMLPFMSKSHIVLGGALPPSRPWCPSRSFKCAVGRAHVHCLEPSLSFSLCL